jgi:hypothetical protein
VNETFAKELDDTGTFATTGAVVTTGTQLVSLAGRLKTVALGS